MADLASLVIGLRADVATLQSDLGKANALAKRSADGMAQSFNSGFASMEGAVKSFAAGLVGALSTGAFIAIGKAAIDAADNFNKMSQKIGIGVEALSALASQAKLSDVSLDSLQGGLAKLARNAADAAAGGKEQAAAFNAIGVAVKDASGNLKPMDQLLGEVAGKFAGYRDSAEKTALAQKLFGKSGADLIVLLNELGEKGFAEVTRAAKEYNQVIGGEQAAQSEQFNDNLTRLQMSVSGFANAVLREALPALVDMTDRMADAAKTADGYESSASKVADILVVVVDNIVELGRVLGDIPSEFEESTKQLDAWATSLGFTNSQMQTFINLIPKIKPVQTGGGLIGVEITPDSPIDKFLNWVNTPTAGSALSDKMGLDTLTPKIENFNGVLKMTVENVDGASTALGGMVGHVDAVGSSTGKATAPVVGLGNATKESAKQSIVLKNAFEDLQKSLKAISAAFDKLNSLNTSFTDQIADLTLKMSGADEAQITYAKNLRDIADVQAQLEKTGMTAAEAISATAEATQNAQTLMQDTRGWEAQQKASELMRAELEKSQKMWGDFADAVFDAVTKSGNFLKNLLENLKQIVTQMLKEWFRTQVIGYFTGAGGGGMSSLASLGMAAIGGVGGGGGSGGGMSGGLTGGSGAYQAGQSMWNGFLGAAGSSQSYMGSLFGSGEWDSGIGSTAAPYLGAAAGVYAGYNRYQQGGGIAGAAAYGLGTYAAGAGVASVAAGGGFAAGVSGAFAIPVVGWIALAAMLIDKFSGGKLFGTKGEVKSGVSTLDIGPGGANYSTFLALKGQSALFGGAKWSTENIAQTPEEAAAAKKFYDSMVATMAQYAEQFGAKAGDLVSAKFGQQFDKHGNPTGITSATIAGHEYANLKPEEFQQAYISANELAILSQFDAGLNATIEQYRDSVTDLNAIAAGLSQAQAMFQSGGEFLAIAGDQTLSAVVHLAEGMQQAGETIGDTIARLVAAQANYDQFVAQFKPAATYTSGFEEALSAINAQMKANADQANALARAAGAEHASTQDLINIHNLAAKQFAAAVEQLKANANSLAASLGYAMPQSLDEINARIAELQGAAGAGSQAIGGFSDAMQNAAQRATESMNLLLGDLSPLNDQEKLQKALEGLRAGTASAEQVLQIGRQLYATGSDYNALFARVMAMARGGVQAVGGGGGGGSSGTGNSEELSELLKQRDAIMAAQQHAGALELAQEIADIVASSQGGSIQDALDAIGITDLPALMKELGIANQTDFETYIKGLEAQTDSQGDSTATLSTDIQAGTGVLNNILLVLQQIAAASGSQPGTPGSFGSPETASAFRDIARALGDRGRGSRSDREATNFSRTR